MDGCGSEIDLEWPTGVNRADRTRSSIILMCVSLVLGVVMLPERFSGSAGYAGAKSATFSIMALPESLR